MTKRRQSFFLLSLMGVLVFGLVGCQNKKEKADPAEEKQSQKSDNHPITVVVLDSSKEELAALDREINKEFEFLELGGVTFKYLAAKEFLSNPIEADLVFYPPTVFGELIKNNLVRKVPEYVIKAEAYSQNDVLRQQRSIFCVHDDTRYAVSLGISGYYLMARTDVLEKNGLEVPQTWRDYGETCSKLSALQKEGKLLGVEATDKWSPSIEPFADNWLATTIIARSAGYVRTRGRYSVLFDYSNWKPLINSPPFARAVDEMCAVSEKMAPAHRNLDPMDVEKAFLNGESVMAIAWPHPPMREQTAETKTLTGAGLFALPGSRQKFDPSNNSWSDADSEEQQVPMLGVGGWCGSVLASSKQSGVATRRLGLLAGKEFSSRLAAFNPNAFPYRASHLGKIDQWVAPELGSSFATNLADELDGQDQKLVWMTRPRVEKAAEYESALANEIRKCLEGAPVEDALGQVEKKWIEINADIDPKFQRSISLQGLGIR